MSDHSNPDEIDAISRRDHRSRQRSSTVPDSRVARPQQIRFAVVGMWIGAAMSMIYVLVWYLELRTLNSRNTVILEQKYGDQLVSADSLLDAGMVVSLGLNTAAALVAVAAWASMAIANGRGIGWARIVATILGVIGLLNTGFAASAAYADEILIPTSTIYYSTNALLVVTIIVLLWLPRSSVFYKAVNTQRHGAQQSQ